MNCLTSSLPKERRIDLSFKQTEPYIDFNTRTKKVQCSYFDLLKKPIEIYLFIDPICPNSWTINPYIRKLQLEYGRFFTIRPILCSHLLQTNQFFINHPEQIDEINHRMMLHPQKCFGPKNFNRIELKYPADIFFAIKAAELQGINAGRRYLQKIQEHLLFNQTDISIDDVLIQVAKEAKLDVDEFIRDLHSNSAKKALRCDLKVSREMEIDQTPSIVFFSESDEDEGLKIAGSYGYDIYVKVLSTLLQTQIQPIDKPELEDFMSYYHFTSSEEIAIIYDFSVKKAEREMKKLQLKQIVKKVYVNGQSYWHYQKQ